MNILNSLEQISFKKLASLTFLAGLILAVPVSVWVVQQQTKSQSKAFFEKPEVIIPEKKYGQPSSGQPKINLVWPFLGKVGDSVLLHGQNLGNNPINKQLTVDGKIVSEKEIIKWTPNLIEFMIPRDSRRGPIKIKIAGKSASWDLPFTVYNLETKTQVTENNDIVRVMKGPAEGKIKIYFSDTEVIESNEFDSVKVPHDKTIVSIEILNRYNQPISFFVEPDEFGF